MIILKSSHYKICMKVVLVPLKYDEYNYGGVLQFYALQYILQARECECKILVANHEKVICAKAKPIKIKIKRVIASIVYFLPNICNRRILEKKMSGRKKRINKFREEHYSDYIYENEINYDDYNAVICGSDQIWNPNYARERAFLKFVPDKCNKVIYAASLGTECLSKEQKSSYKPLVERIQHISVREHSAKKILDDFVHRDDIKVVLDPTLLLTPEEWLKIADKNVYNLRDKYIFTYFLGDYSKSKDYILAFAKHKNFKIVNIPFASGERVDRENFGDIKIIDASPDAFLGLIEAAEFIFTDSFHASVFSVLFKKEFYIFQRDGSGDMMGRIDTLLSSFRLSDRVIRSGQSIKEMPKIDYSQNDVIQEQLRRKSLEFLWESIKNE